MKESTSVYETSGTEMAAALMALGFDLADNDPLRRVFTPERPANESVTHGLKRGGKVFYRIKTESSEFANSAGECAEAYGAKSMSADFDARLMALRDKLAGTEAGQMLDALITELPLEIARYQRAAFENRRNLIDTLATRRDIVEMVYVPTGKDSFVIHHAKLPPEEALALIENSQS